MSSYMQNKYGKGWQKAIAIGLEAKMAPTLQGKPETPLGQDKDKPEHSHGEAPGQAKKKTGPISKKRSKKK